ncbi:BTAD domain-containing putative transcriptional regulator [Actinoplanes sp. NPDC051513]|uniref:AfsR/SARP family transcriptional regulator n=1 Tax=Actinoplanes sp. NPDC051513 TaxID=3363908 RepID=UPI0037A68286
MEFLLLGTLEVRDRDGEPIAVGRRQERCLLGLLLLDVGRTVSTERLVSLLWPERPAQDPRATLRTYVSRLRSRIAASSDGAALRLSVKPGGVLAETDPALVDAHRFARQVHLARADADPTRRSELLGPALALWRGPLLADVASDGLRERVGAELTELRLAATWMYVDAELARGRHHEVLGALATSIAAYPLHEPLVGRFMLALHRAGRDADALTAYQNLRARMADALGTDPSPQLRDRYVAILRQDPALDSPEASDQPAHGVPEKIATGGHRSTGPDVPAQLPVAMSGFVGREAQLARLDAILAATGKQRTSMSITVLSGTAGVGKTTLAVHWAHRVADRFPDGQLYINLRGFDPGDRAMAPAEAMRGFLDALGVPPERAPSTLDAQAALFRSLLAGKQMLVLLDNARDADQVRPLLPGGPTALAVVTSRNQLTPLVAIDNARPLAIDLLSTAEAQELLVGRLGTDRVAAEPYAVDQIITACARLPLALAVAAARIQQTGFSLAILAAELRDTATRLDALDAGDATSQVRAVFSCSYNVLTPSTARLFRLLGLHPGPDISIRAVASLAGVSPPQAKVLLDELARANLIVEHVPGRFASHDLLRAYATELVNTVDTGADRSAAWSRTLDYYLHTADVANRLQDPHRDWITLSQPHPGADPEDLAGPEHALAWFIVERPVLVAITRQAAAMLDTRTWQLAWNLADFLDGQGHWHDWTTTQNAALEVARQHADRIGMAHAHRSLGRAYTRLSQGEDADWHARQALELYRQLGNPIGQGRSSLRLAGLLERRGDYAEALHHCRQALDLFVSAGYLAGKADALNAIGWCHAKLGDHEHALTYCREALVAQQEIGDQAGAADTWDSLGYSHHHLRHYPQAITCYQRAIELFQGRGDRYYEAVSLIHLGDTHDGAGDTDAARGAWQHALAILSQLGHSDANQVRTRLHGSGQRGVPKPPSPRRASQQPRPGTAHTS